MKHLTALLDNKWNQSLQDLEHTITDKLKIYTQEAAHHLNKVLNRNLVQQVLRLTFVDRHQCPQIQTLKGCV